MDTLLWLTEIDDPVVDHTNTLTEYVPAGTLKTTYAVVDELGARLLKVDVATCNV